MSYYAQFNSKNVLVDIDTSLLRIDEYNSTKTTNTQVTEELYTDYKNNPDKYIAGKKNGVLYPVLNPNYEQEQVAIREEEFNKAFFNTSLGYIRRSVTMADGSKKDFLSDLLPVISMGVQSGQAVNILTYDQPPFTEDVEDWTQYQHQVTVTPQFIRECFIQLSNDFLPINEE